MFHGVCLFLVAKQVTRKQQDPVPKSWGLFKYNLSVSVALYALRQVF